MDLCNFKGEQNTITEALQLRLPEHAVISVIGAGGKTSLIFAWARELAESGKRVAITTTTHMLSPERMLEEPENIYAGIELINTDLDDATDRIDKALEDKGIAFAASPDPVKASRVTLPPQAILEHLYESADVTLIEADGSKRLPLKWPAPHEPAVPDRTDITVYVVGLSGLGQKAEDVIYMYEGLPDGLKRDAVDVNLLHRMISSREGGRKGALGEFRVFLNQVDGDLDRLAASYRLQQILSVMGIQTAWGSLSGLSGHKVKESPAGTEIAIILEAAGNSTRFGGNKLLHIMEDGRPMAACVMDAVCEALETIKGSPSDREISFKKILVTQYDDVATLAPDFDVVMNDRPDLGISHSMQLGIKAAGKVDAYMFFVCDQPYLKPASICHLIREYKKGTAGIVSLAWKGEMRNPKIFSSKYKSELMDLSGDTGGRQIISAHKKDLLLVEADSEDEVMDMDSADK